MRNGLNNIDELYMMECFALAQKGAGYVSPNPMVGAVIVKNSKLLGRGYHKKFGSAHAEVEAIHNAKSSVHGSTLYVNLEPCNFYGKTPPCTDLIISKGIVRVVVGMLDPNPRVAGKGIQQLRNADVKVDVGVLEEECKIFNEIFIKFITTGLPFVTLKIAQTLDGKIADTNDNSKWITNTTSRKLVHSLRARYDAVLVGAGTVKKDNPELTVRDVKGRNSIRIVLDGSFKVNPNAAIWPPTKSQTILFVSKKAADNHQNKKKQLLNKGVEVIEIPGQSDNSFSLIKILKTLGSKGITSILVEGGASTFSSFVNQKAADKLLVFIAPKLFGSGLDPFAELQNLSYNKFIDLKDIHSWNLQNDILIEGYFNKK